MKKVKARYTYRFRTCGGWFCLTATSEGLYALDFGRRVPSRSRLEKVPGAIRSLLRNTASRVRSYLKGRGKMVERFPIDWSGYRLFEKRVLQELRRIPSGEIRSYQFLAGRAGRPRAARYVGKIMGMNRLPLILPCHRILPKSGGLGGFSKGERWKKRLLKLECPGADTKGNKRRLL